MGRKSIFGGSTLLSAQDFQPESFLPHNTHLVGILQQIKPPLFDRKIDQATGTTRLPKARIELQLKCQMEIGEVIINDYAPLPSGSIVSACITMELWPEGITLGDEVELGIRSILEDSLRYISTCLGRIVSLPMDDMEVISVKDVEGLKIDLRGTGQRMIKPKGRDAFELLRAPRLPSATPQWFGTPTPNSAGPSPSSYPTPKTDDSPQPKTEPVDPPMRPLSSHKVPTIQKKKVQHTPQGGRDGKARSDQPFTSTVNMTRTTSASSSTRGSRTSVPNESHAGTRAVKTEDTLHRSTDGALRGNESKRDLVDPSSSEHEMKRARRHLVDADRDVDPVSQEWSDFKQPDQPAASHRFVEAVPSVKSEIPSSPTSDPFTSKGTVSAARGIPRNTVNPSEPRSRNSTTSPKGSTGMSRTSSGNSVRGDRRSAVASGSSMTRNAINGTTPRESPNPRQPYSSPNATNTPTPTSASTKMRREAESRAKAEAEKRFEERQKLEREKERCLADLHRPLSTEFHTYNPITSLSDGIKANVMGVVIEVTSPRATRKDHIMDIVIADPSTHKEGRTSEDFVVTLFRPTEQELPTSISPGTPILFRGLKIKQWKTKLKGQAFSNDPTGWAFIPGGKKVRLSKPEDLDPPPGEAEVDHLKALYEWWKTTNEGRHAAEASYVDGTPGPSPTKDGYTLSQIHEGLFFDAVFKIVHVVPSVVGGSKLWELYITDGTVHPAATRNYHGVDAKIPTSAVFCLAVHEPETDDVELFQRGKIVKMRNVRTKLYHGELELAWSEKLTEDQVAKGWRKKRCTVISENDDRARVINTRINALKRGEVPVPAPEPPARTPMQEIQPQASVIRRSKNLSSDLCTTHTDEVKHPITALAAVKANKLVPNRFRVQARVRSLHAKDTPDAPNPVYMQKHCHKCKRKIPTTTAYCQSCNDKDFAHGAIVYRFVAILEQDDTTVPIVIADEEAEAFLPPLPPLPRSDNPNDEKKLRTQLLERSREVERVLLGPKQEGERIRPIIDWTLETVEVKVRGKDETVVVIRPFGMKRGPGSHGA